MRRPVTAAFLASILVVTACAANGGASDHPGASGGPVIASTVAPITDLVRQILGERGTLTGLVPDGVDSHTYEPAPGDARTLSEADLVVANGLELEEPTLQLAEANLPEHGEILTLANQTITPDEWAFDFTFPEEQGTPNPHLWLDVTHAKAYVELIRDALVELDPDGEATYQANAAAYLDELDDLDEAIAETIDTIPEEQRKLVTYHDSWPYFGERYDIEVVGAVQPSDFAEPSAGEVRTLVEQIRDEEIPAVFGSEVFPSDVVRTIAEETGATYVEELNDDALPGDPGDPEHSYVGMMLANVRTMATHLDGDAAALDAIDVG